MEGSMSRIFSACAAGCLIVAIGGAAQAQSGDVTFVIGTMNWQGNSATAPVDIGNTTGAPLRPGLLACDFVSVGRVVGTDRERTPPLGVGEHTTVTVSADTGGQLVDSIRCQLQ
jgi:hypothetical protein